MPGPFGKKEQSCGWFAHRQIFDDMREACLCLKIQGRFQVSGCAVSEKARSLANRRQRIGVGALVYNSSHILVEPHARFPSLHTAVMYCDCGRTHRKAPSTLKFSLRSLTMVVQEISVYNLVKSSNLGAYHEDSYEASSDDLHEGAF